MKNIKEKNIKNKYFKKITLTVLVFTMIMLMIGCSATKDQNNNKDTENIVETTNTPETTNSPEIETNEATTDVEDTSISITDAQERTVTFEQVPQKIAVLLASDVEILYELGAQDSIVAVGEYCNYPAEALEKEVVSTGEELNIEQIIALEPEVVVMGSMGQTQEQIEQLEKAGLKVIVTNSQNIADTYVAIEMLGKLSGKETESQNLIEEMKKEFAAIKEKAETNNEKNNSIKKTLYFEVSPLEYGLWTTGTGTFMQELADIVGVTNIFEDVTGWAEVSEEQVIERNPEFIITSTMYFGEGVKPVDEILGRPNWDKITAVKNKNVFNGDNDMMTRPGPRLVDAANELYKFIYGE